MALKEILAKVQEFARQTNFLAAVITNADAFFSNGYLHDKAMELAVSYSKTDIQELINAIFEGVDNSHTLQMAFDLWKRQLNTIVLPNYDDGHYYSEFGGLQYFDEATDIRENLLSVCGDLRNEIADFVQAYQLTDNSPKLGFLCPLFYESDEVTTGVEISQQEAVKQPIASKPQPKAKAGRKVQPFTSCLTNIDNPTQKQRLTVLHRFIQDESKGKYVALVIKAAIQLGWITRPTFSQLKREFGDIGGERGYNHQIGLSLLGTDLEGMKTALLSAL